MISRMTFSSIDGSAFECLLLFYYYCFGYGSPRRISNRTAFVRGIREYSTKVIEGTKSFYKWITVLLKLSQLPHKP